MSRISHLVLSLATLATLATTPAAHAAPPPDAPGWIRQGGNGAAGSTAQQAFGVTEILFRTDQFEDARTHLKTTDRWRGWGATERSDGTFQLFMTQGGTDASWSKPQPAMLRDPSGQDVPFLLGDAVHFGVAFQNLRQDLPAYLIVYWNGEDTTADSTHVAVSADGVNWFDDAPIGDDGLLADGTFRDGIMGASQVFWNPRNSFCTTAPTASFPFDCALQIVFTAVSPTGATSIATAGSDRFDVLETAFTARSTPLLSPGTTWDAGSVDLAKMRRRTEPFGAGFEMTYAGTTTATGCTGSATCSIGVASSSNRLSWTRNNPARAATEARLFEDLLGTDVSLGPATFAFDGNSEGHARGFITAADGSPSGSTWVALTSPAPSTAPTLEVSKPDNGFYNSGALEVDLFANDDLGANPGINRSTIELTIDGIPAEDLGLAWFTQPTIVGSFYELGVRIVAPKADVHLEDGEHVLAAVVEDLDGEVATLTTQFTIDTAAPVTTIDEVDSYQPYLPGIQFSPPFGRGMWITGTTTDAGSGVERLTAVVTNGVGQRTAFDSRNPGSGFSITQVSANEWTWRWDMPVHPGVMIPGPMTVSILGTDPARNVELPNGQNSVGVLSL